MIVNVLKIRLKFAIIKQDTNNNVIVSYEQQRCLIGFLHTN